MLHGVEEDPIFLACVGLNRCPAQPPARRPLWGGQAHQSNPRIRLAVEIEPDGNWLHITWFNYRKFIASEGLKKFESGFYLSQPSSRSVHCLQAPGGEGGGEGGGEREGSGWQRASLTAQQSRQLAEADVEGQVDELILVSGGVVHWWSRIPVSIVSWVHGTSPRLGQPGCRTAETKTKSKDWESLNTYFTNTDSPHVVEVKQTFVKSNQLQIRVEMIHSVGFILAAVQRQRQSDKLRGPVTIRACW